jgi:hypothetical protein
MPNSQTYGGMQEAVTTSFKFPDDLHLADTHTYTRISLLSYSSEELVSAVYKGSMYDLNVLT